MEANFAVPEDNRVKIKESEKSDYYQDIAWELNHISNMRVTVIPVVISALGTNLKCFVKGLENLEIRRQMETIQIIA